MRSMGETVVARRGETTTILALRPAAPRLLAEVVDLYKIIKALFDPYRPEQHYMRGPGPRWHAKHDLVSAHGNVQRG